MDQIKIENKADLKKLSTLREYGDLCGVKRASIHLRVNHKIPAKQLPTVDVDPLTILLLLDRNPEIEEERKTLRKAAADAAGKLVPLVMVDHVANPPRKRKPGRRPEAKGEVGKTTQAVADQAAKLGYALNKRGYGYDLVNTNLPSHQQEAKFYKNLGLIRIFLRSLEAEPETQK